MSFGYEDGAEGTDRTRRLVLQGITLSVARGERVGLVGAAGCGKSTVLDLFERLHHHYAGSITINGRDLRTTDRTSMAQEVGYVGQRPTLFPGTIRDNLVMGRPGITEADLDEAYRKADILEHVRSRPGAYDAAVSQKGEIFSGGQQQRLCIARALLSTPSIMLLDEPTSALDGPSQAVVQRAIDELDGVTMLVVAHRLSTLETMDRIVVLHEGQIVEDGAYADLAVAGGPFSAMLNREPWSATTQQ